jgi:hypothetical protein
MVEAASILSSLGVAPSASADGEITVCSPIDGSLLGRVHADDAASVAAKIARAEAAFHEWSLVPAPRSVPPNPDRGAGRLRARGGAMKHEALYWRF